MTLVLACAIIAFLSTLSLRRATVNTSLALSALGDFYPRSPCGERLNGDVLLSCFDNFYPRSPCGERLGGAREEFAAKIFLSTLSLRRATITDIDFRIIAKISIHALLTESDLADCTKF